MQHYFVNEMSNNIFNFDKETSHHITNVMRMKNNEKIICVYEKEFYLCEVIIKDKTAYANIVSKINDVNEYFLRCYQLEKIFEPKTSKTDNKTFETMIINDEIEYNNDYSQEPIGVYANTTFRNALIKITDKNIVEKLTNKQYCSEIFKLNFPLLSSKRKDEKGRNRYYKQEIRILGTTYYLCSQWYEKSRKYIEVWIQQNCN